MRKHVVKPEGEGEGEKEGKDILDIEDNHALVRSTLNNSETRKQKVPTNTFSSFFTSRQICQELHSSNVDPGRDVWDRSRWVDR